MWRFFQIFRSDLARIRLIEDSHTPWRTFGFLGFSSEFVAAAPKTRLARGFLGLPPCQPCGFWEESLDGGGF